MYIVSIRSLERETVNQSSVTRTFFSLFQFSPLHRGRTYLFSFPPHSLLILSTYLTVPFIFRQLVGNPLSAHPTLHLKNRILISAADHQSGGHSARCYSNYKKRNKTQREYEWGLHGSRESVSVFFSLRLFFWFSVEKMKSSRWLWVISVLVKTWRPFCSQLRGGNRTSQPYRFILFFSYPHALTYSSFHFHSLIIFTWIFRIFFVLPRVKMLCKPDDDWV